MMYGGVMKVLRVGIYLLIAFSGAPGFAAEPAAATDPLSGVAALLTQEHQHPRPSTPPMSLAQLETAASANNPEIRVATRRVAIAETRVRTAGSLSDPEFMYRGWGTPLAKPWDLNQTQHMFMFNQSLPGPGKRALRTQLASEEVEQVKAQLEAKKRDVKAEVRKTFYDLLRNQDELLLHDEQAALARQSSESARIKYVVGRVPQQDVLKAQIALTKLIEHLVMLEQDAALARAALDSLLGRSPDAPIAVSGEYALPAQLPTLTELGTVALQSRPELLAALAQIKQNEDQLKLANK